MYCNLNVQKQKTKTNKYELRISNRNEARGKQEVILILLNESFLKNRRKPLAKQQNNNVWVKPRLKNRADSSAYNNLVHEWIHDTEEFDRIL